MSKSSLKNPARRRLFQAAGATGVAAAIPLAKVAEAANAKSGARASRETVTPQGRNPYLFLNRAEAAFIEAACARLIPGDESGPGAIEAGVPQFIDRQLAGAWGAGERLYRAGPWSAGTSSQGYQLPFTPAELFRNALRAVNTELARRETPFAKMAPKDQDAYLDSLQKGKEDLGGVPANVFFETLLETTLEGYFSDPVYGGNRGMVAWKTLGFPGAYANYYALVDQHNLAFAREPISLAQSGDGEIHVHPDIPARLVRVEK